MSVQYTRTLVTNKTKDYITTIKLLKSTKDRLARQGYAGESMDTILIRLLDLADKKGGVRK